MNDTGAKRLIEPDPLADPGAISSSLSRAADVERWSDAEEVNDLVERCAHILFALCRADYRGWMSESDLQCMFHNIARKELAARGLHASAVHADYVFRISLADRQTQESVERAIPVDVALVVPESIRILRGRHWEADVAAIIEVKRGHERHREIEHDLQNLATIVEEQPHVQAHMLIMGYRSKLEDMAIAERMAQALDIPLLHDNYWGTPIRPSQPALVTQREPNDLT